MVKSDGSFQGINCTQADVGVSPALNVKLSSVLFASESGMNKASTLTTVSDSTAKTWKLTLLDSSKSVSVSNGQNITRADNGGAVTITVPYTYADSNTTNAVSQISVMLTDKAYDASDAKVLYYGALQGVTISNTTGTGTFTLPSDLADKTCGTDYYAYIIAEDVNGNTETDYASTPQSITIPAVATPSTPVVAEIPDAPVNGKGLGISIIANPIAPANTTDAWKGSFVYFGTYNNSPVKYRVLSRKTTDFGGTTMLLDCDNGLGQAQFDASSNEWGSSAIKIQLNGSFLIDNFTSIENAAIAESTKASATSTDGNGWSELNYAALSGEKIFLLDAKEATNTGYGYSNTNTGAANRRKPGIEFWWLRSTDSTDNDCASAVQVGDSIYGALKRNSNGDVSPALNVKLSSVLFSSVLSGTSGQPGAEYKLTLLDDKMSITPGSIIRASGDVITVPYSISGINGNHATQVSLMVLDKEYTQGNTNGAKLVNYQKLADASVASGAFTLTADMKNSSYDYYIVAEDVNSGNLTDYASTPVKITIPASVSKFNVTVTDGTLGTGNTSGEYEQGDTVTITANTAPNGQPFKGWSVVSGAVTLADATSTTTTFSMPAEAVSVKAEYEPIPAPVITTQPDSGESEEQDTPSTPKMNYQIINGVNSIWTLGSSEGLTIRGNGAFSKLVGVKQDGSLLDRINYTAREGSTIITLNASYLNTLAAGTHTVEILWTDGSAGTVFTIHADTSGDSDNTQNTNVILPDNSTLPDSTDRKDDVPKTGDSAPAVWLFVLAGLSGAGLMLTGRKREKPRKR